MFGKTLSTAIIFLAFCPAANAQAENKIGETAIINGAAKYLPKPDYPQEAKEACADGLVNVEVSIDENGDVISAEAVTGDELLRVSAVEAAKKAKFRRAGDGVPVGMKGVIVYNFTAENKCLKKGIINDRALNIPKPQVKNIYPKHFRASKEETVHVQVIIDVLTGKVTKATAVSGHPMLRAACEVSARQAKFPPFYHGAGILVKAVIAYKFKPDGKIEF